MLEIRRGEDRGQADHGWLKSMHSFSFADYYDADHQRFGVLRVINEDRVVPGAGFGAHGHRDMEIISYVVDGELEHRDSLGNGSIVRPGDVQRMTAGIGIRHSEFNPSHEKPLHFLQIWIQPNRYGLEPSYEQRNFASSEKRGRLRLVASPDGADGSVQVHQDVRIYSGLFDGNERAALAQRKERLTYVQVIGGKIEVNGTLLNVGDAAKIREAESVSLEQGKAAEVLVFDLPTD